MRTRMITRTITTTHISAMAVDTAKAEIIKRVFYVTGEYNAKDLEKIAKKYVEQEENVKFVSISNTYTEEQIFGMTEEEFVALAKPIER